MTIPEALARVLIIGMHALPIAGICLFAARYIRRREVDTMERIFSANREFPSNGDSGE